MPQCLKPAERQPAPGELRDDDGPYGFEAQFYRKETGFMVSRRFEARWMAVQWAEEERKAIDVEPDG